MSSLVNYYGVTKSFHTKCLFRCTRDEIREKEIEYRTTKREIEDDFYFFLRESFVEECPMSTVYHYKRFFILDSRFQPYELILGDFELDFEIPETWAAQGAGSMSRTFLKYTLQNIHTLECVVLRSKVKEYPILKQLLRELKGLNRVGLTEIVRDNLNDFK